MHTSVTESLSQGDGVAMRLQLLALALLLSSAAAEPRQNSTPRPRHWQRGARTLADRSATHFVGYVTFLRLADLDQRQFLVSADALE
ncbi:unnamed protein product [Leptidea sinapis]|uniref:Uncharacterized protein n=1 Tax=Leptidea sinapis TaxID=189913 RepID=A0A5E4QPH3_9NEOP|nr:unnamed protein product [Leptidea sinapis]